ncbi:MAG: hypothetical protein HY319_21295 [Armatimonadetes bacterium]|nr:hypothetical protein [Armatimonadota bacterium]
MDFELAAQHAGWLQALRRDVEAGHQTRVQVFNGPGAPTPAQVDQLLALARAQHDELLFKYGKAAAQFERQQLPGLAQELKAELQNKDEAARIYAQIQADRMRTDAEIYAIQQEAHDHASRIHSEVYNHRKMVYDENNRRWSQTFRGVPCPHFCPRCNRALDMYGRCPVCSPW